MITWKDLGTELPLIPLQSRAYQKLSLTGKNTQKGNSFSTCYGNIPYKLHICVASRKLSGSKMTGIGRYNCTKPDSKIDLVKPIYVEMKCFELIFYWKTINYNECCHRTRLALWKYACRKTDSPATASKWEASKSNVFTHLYLIVVYALQEYVQLTKATQEINA